jgi:hypothetical protein
MAAKIKIEKGGMKFKKIFFEEISIFSNGGHL